MAILTELRDPRIKNVTVLGAEVPGDLRAAKVSVSVMGGPKQEKLAMQGLESARGFLQRKVGARLDLRFVPELSFKLDRGLKNAAETSRLLRELEEREGPLNPERAAELLSESAGESGSESATFDDGEANDAHNGDGAANAAGPNADDPNGNDDDPNDDDLDSLEIPNLGNNPDDPPSR